MIVTLNPKPALVEALSSKVLRGLPRPLWHEVFVERNASGVSFEEHTLTLLHADPDIPASDAAGADLLKREFHWLASTYQGKVDHTAAPSALTLFKNSRSALRMAMALQHTVQDVRFRVGIHTAACTLGIFEAQDRHWAVVVGPERAQAASMAFNAVAGTVAISASSYQALGDALGEETGGALLSEEFDSTSLVQATVILAPRPTAFQSSFAGLGLT